MNPRTTLELPRDRAAPFRARAALAAFDTGLREEKKEIASLLLSELVTNAVKYGGDGPLRVEMTTTRKGFRTEVVDQGSGLSYQLRDGTDLETPGGWGLHLVDALADRWGAHVASTHVWFELERD